MSQKRVTIDAGHGGKYPAGDPGAVNGSKHEAVATLAIAKKVGAKLKAKGYAVKYTRTSDKAVSLAERCRISNAYGADAFISIHLNAASNPEAHGVETWRYERVGSTTKRLAENIQTELVSATGFRNRGVKTSGTLYVLKHTVAPAALCEVGFISNRDEARLLFTEKYQNKIASAIAEGVDKTLSK